MTTWTSLRRPLTNRGRSGRSISRQARIPSVDGRPSRRKNEPGILPTEYCRSSTSTVRGKKSNWSLGVLPAVVAYLDTDTTLLSTTTAGKTPKDQFDFFPLTVDVEERQYSVGKIPGSFFRREGRPSTEGILACRLIDRPLRPLFVKGLRNEVQVVITVMSLHPEDTYDVLAINAASLSTQISGLPFSGPVAGVRIAFIDGQWVAFPRY